MNLKIRNTFRRISRKRLRKTRKGGNISNFSVKYNISLHRNIPNKLSLEQTAIAPSVFFIPENGKLYTILMYDPDAPSKPSWVHWIVTNISTPDTISYNTVLLYSRPNPPYGATHRYFFGLYEQQSGKINPMISGIRGGFDYNSFVKENNLKLINQVIMSVSAKNIASK